MGNTNGRICPVCKKYYFTESNAFEDSPVCGWVDDLVQRTDPDYTGGFNRLSVNQAKAKYAKGKRVFE